DIYQNLQQNKQNKTPNSPEINTPTPYMIGYLAWNLGEYKVFCPRDTVTASDMKQNCIQIKADQLQVLPRSVLNPTRSIGLILTQSIEKLNPPQRPNQANSR
ncbi:MAG: hypothetical protein KA498_11405, partial [Neisseriaceae bacterium]|nr:hypothetical protein [Neisseriaceae bacterium]